MAETLCAILGTVSGGSLKSLGFVNVPEGTWIVKSSSSGLTINSTNNSTHIPICVLSTSCDCSAYGSFSGGGSGSNTTKINNQQVASCWANASGGTISGNTYKTAVEHRGTAYNVFLPAVFGLDLSKCQAYSCTASVWLEKK